MRRTKFFTCDRCGGEIPDYLTFGSWGDRYYCLGHVPRLVRLRMWLRGKLRARA